MERRTLPVWGRASPAWPLFRRAPAVRRRDRHRHRHRGGTGSPEPRRPARSERRRRPSSDSGVRCSGRVTDRNDGSGTRRTRTPQRREAIAGTARGPGGARARVLPAPWSGSRESGGRFTSAGRRPQMRRFHTLAVASVRLAVPATRTARIRLRTRSRAYLPAPVAGEPHGPHRRNRRRHGPPVCAPDPRPRVGAHGTQPYDSSVLPTGIRAARAGTRTGAAPDRLTRPAGRRGHPTRPPCRRARRRGGNHAGKII